MRLKGPVSSEMLTKLLTSCGLRRQTTTFSSL
jgi:hypothetical protein